MFMKLTPMVKITNIFRLYITAVSNLVGSFRAIGGGTVVEHLTLYPTIEGSNSAARTGREETKWRRYNLLGLFRF